MSTPVSEFVTTVGDRMTTDLVTVAPDIRAQATEQP